ncbi:hypothetical protein [Cohaesibacter celericrescens]|uniref:Uncharacterized protein n=1 Tax=Cohaesibacter celericrescens TaxID=2067669 RepID=A0A2N5XX72_9HYPH|nr:hypothetical protein [Cohaesibacter celericrescens]PLW79089.1 hypothetical protein C0081_02330 [Cohaesibacter celericrescens]
MGNRRKKQTFTPTRRIAVYEVPDQVSGNVFYRAAGPFQNRDIRDSLLTFGELIELRDRVNDLVKAKQQSEVA